MELRAGKPVWLARRPKSLRTARLRTNVSCDVAIIGAGITGTLVAHQLLAAGLDVVMLDKREAGYGSTAASTGLLLYQPDTSIGELTRRHGRQTAERVYQLGRAAVREIGALVRRLRIDCHYHARRTLYVASRRRDRTWLDDEARRTRSLGFPVETLDTAGVRRAIDTDFAAALAASGAAEVDAFALNRGVLARCQHRRNFRLFQHTQVRSVEETGPGVVLRTTDGNQIDARHAIVAAGYESRDFVQSKLVALHSTYVIASPRFAPEALHPLRYLMWETARPYFYLRTTADHRVVFGGRDDPFANPSRRDRRLRLKTRELESQFAAHFPPLAFRAEYAWTGTFADTTDGLPCIGPVRPHSRVLYALGYGGNGITFSQIAARLLRDTCLGRRNRDAALFAFDR